tara:strand:- start:681 stop:1601 length:921 start_codon:yes stop_codon:yes gene_type:complete
MKKILGILVLGLLLSGNVYAKNTKLVKEKFYSGNINWKFMDYDLPEGKWKFFHKSHWSVSNVQINCIEFIQTENGIWKAFYDICEINNGGKLIHHLGLWLVSTMKTNKYDNCTLRPEYYYAQLWTKGISMNCFKTRHLNIDKELNDPDDPEGRGYLAYLKRYIEDNDIVVPKTAINSYHLFFSPLIKDKGIEIIHTINPEFFGASETIHRSEVKSEYHRDNIDFFPNKKKFMINWTNKKAEFHKRFEEQMKAKNHQKLDLKQFSITEISISNDKDFTKQLKDLNELYESGALTKKEFKKAKSKLLN